MDTKLDLDQTELLWQKYYIQDITYNSSNMFHYVTPTAAEINSFTEIINAEVK